MKDRKKQLSIKPYLKLFYMVLIVTSLIGCWNTDKHIQQDWQEEIQLSNGASIWVHRQANFIRKKPDFLTKEGGEVSKMMATIAIPDNLIAPPPPVWHFNAVPILLDYDQEKKSWFVIATYFYCNSWTAAGYPPITQWQYIVENGRWIIVPLDKKYLGRHSNLLSSFTDDRIKLQKVSKEDIREAKKHLVSGSGYKVIQEKRTLCTDFRNSK